MIGLPRTQPGPRALAAAAALATCAALAPLAHAPGISRDEGRVMGGAVGEVRAAPLAPLPTPDVTAPEPPLGRAAARTAHGLFSRLGAGHVRSLRLGTVAFAAGLSALLAIAGHGLAGGAGAILALLLFWLVPRHLHAGLLATPDVAAAALWLATAWAYRLAQRAERPATRRAAAAGAGLLLGAALTARTDAWLLLAALALHALVAPRLAGPSRPAEETAAQGSPAARGRGGLLALAAMALLGPALLVASWPWLWADVPARLAAAFAPGRAPASGAWDFLGAALAGRPPARYALVVTSLTLPAAVLWTYGGGLLHALARAVRALARRDMDARDDLLLALAAAAPFVASTAGVAPLAAGVRPWLPAMPFLALLGARALVVAASWAWAARRGPLLAALAVLVLWPALRQTIHAFPAGASAWNELAGGAPGAASLGMQRQDGGEAAAAVLDLVNERSRRGARIWWPRTAPEAVNAWTRDGRLRADLSRADGPELADLAVVALDGASRDDEYRAWAALRTARASAGAYLDEVPLVLVYARGGAWR